MASGDPTMITVVHWRRLLDGELYVASSVSEVHGEDAAAPAR